MTLKVSLPFGIFLDEADVARIVVETAQGSFGLLPRRLDCVTALVPGILSYETAANGEHFLALDEGVLVKTGRNVVISVRRALRGDDLACLRDAIDREFLRRDADADEMRAAMTRLESGFLRRLAALGDRPS